ncbi:Zinc finger BED domain-containing protein 5 [Araneus ventricosus]|uniref:Zinc finger BED domain-containing protein 5 n=1 Tax=Araneus ventricosus TaxID=182803 RepID=A0A4Y2DW25_ARAVE|nr:Zinc finger BED domain-containing protein 5 [Araneus ventricosus]
MEITVDQQDDNHEVQRPTDWPVQVDESTDVSDLSILLVIARYLNVNELEENLLLCNPLTKRCTCEDIFNVIQGYFCENEIDWAKCCGVCTDGGKSMSGCYKGLRGRIKIVAPHLAWSHCCIHRQSLAAKPLPDSLKEALNQSVKVVNFIKANSTNTRLFKSLCGDMGNLHTTLLLHTEVR